MSALKNRILKLFNELENETHPIQFMFFLKEEWEKNKDINYNPNTRIVILDYE